WVLGCGGAPSPSESGALSTNLLTNPGLELDGDGNGLADCWQRSGTGTNTGSSTRVTDAHGGTYAERLAISSYTDGDRKLITQQGTTACSPAVSAGATYQLSAWYKS